MANVGVGCGFVVNGLDRDRMVTQNVARSRGGHKLGIMLSGYLGHGDHGDLLRNLECKGALQRHGGRGGRRGILRRGAGVSKFVVHVPVHQSAVVGEPGEVVERLSTVLALVNPVPPMGLNVRSQIVSAGVALSTDVTSKRFFASMNPHVASKVRSSDKTMVAHVA